MLKNENIICISSIDWDFIWQGHQEIMSSLARCGNKVLFIENTGVRPPGIRDIPRIRQRIKNWLKGVKGIRQESENLYIYSPLVLPFPYFRLARWINCHLILPVLDKWMKIMGFTNPIVWTFLPTPLSQDIIDSINRKLLIYYCIDNFTVSSASAKKIKKSEKALLRKADLVFVTSSQLHNYCSRYNKKVYKFPFAVNFEKFEAARLRQMKEVDELKEIPRPIVGYVGGVHKWIDQSLIEKTAESLPEYSFVFVGPLQTKLSLSPHLKNVHFLGKKEHDRLPSFIKNFDVCIIPYQLTHYTKNVYPTKLNEYHAMGKPVVSTELPEINDFNSENSNLVSVAATEEEFGRQIVQSFNNTDKELPNKRIESARKNSWSARIDQMSNLVEVSIREKIQQPANWKESFLKLYKNSRRGLAKTVFAVLGAYLLLFYTPLTWFVAKPLKISDMPRAADCIVVFAGGVGESGRPMQGYQERVQYAVDLYKAGYARQVIFSSGYTYVYDEPLVMKALAVSLGVPQDIVILEDKAKNTVQNVKFVSDILEERGWSEILLVSSPYHMRRASLVFNKAAPDVEVAYTPIPESRFYSHGIDEQGRKNWKQLNLQQLRAILHEYAAIVNYWFKGHI